MATQIPIPPPPMSAGGQSAPSIGQQGQPSPNNTLMSSPAGLNFKPMGPSPQQQVEAFMQQIMQISDQLHGLSQQYPTFDPSARLAIEVIENGVQPVVLSIGGAEQPPSPRPMGQ